MPFAPSPASALLTVWQDDAGVWHASIVLPDGARIVFDSPFELARWSRGAVRALPAPAPSPAPAPAPTAGLR